MAYKPVNRQFIETPNTTYTLNAEEIKNDAIVYFNDVNLRTVNLIFPVTFEAGHKIEAYQAFPQGLGNIIVSASFLSPDLSNFRKPDCINLVTLTNSKVKIIDLKNTLIAYAIVDPSLFLDATTAEVTSYRDRYRMRVYNRGSSSIEVGLDNIPIDGDWIGISQYTLEVTAHQFVPKGGDGYLMQRITWYSTAGMSPQGGGIVFDWTKLSNETKTVDITDDTTGEITYNLYKKPLITLI